MSINEGHPTPITAQGAGWPVHRDLICRSCSIQRARRWLYDADCRLARHAPVTAAQYDAEIRSLDRATVDLGNLSPGV